MTHTNNTSKRVFGAALALTAALLAIPDSPSRAQTQRAGAKPHQVKLDVKQGDKKTGLKLFVERGELTKITATDSAGTRSLKRVDRLAIPCAEEEKECKTVELENGKLVGVCYCKGSDTILIGLLLPAVQKVREAAASSSAGPHVKVFDGRTGAEAQGDDRKPACWADEKLKLSICPE
jgi:hypothetical protein